MAELRNAEMSEPDVRDSWSGREERYCGDHRTTGQRAWCYDCSEWCYPSLGCHGCEQPLIEKRLAAAEKLAEAVEELRRVAAVGPPAPPRQGDTPEDRESKGWYNHVVKLGYMAERALSAYRGSQPEASGKPNG